MGANCKIAGIFSEIASMLEIQDANVFKIRAYLKAADLISAMDTDLSEVPDPSSIKGIGREMSSKIKEFLGTGEVEYHKRLRSDIGDGALEMLKIRGLGPKTVRLFFEAGIKNVDALERRLGRPDPGIKGIGKKKSEAILEAVKFYRSNLSVHRLGLAISTARFIAGEISKISGVSDVRPVGDLRRMTETISQIEMLVRLENGGDGSVQKKFLESLSAAAGAEFGEMENSGQTASAVVSFPGIGIKTVIYITKPDGFFFNLARLTGSRNHWSKLASLGKNCSFNSARSEEQVYSKAGLQFIAPELREDTGEIEAAARNSLPALVEISDIKGDLHTHTRWSDGRDTVHRMALAAKERGYEYIALTDHSPSSTVANGLSAERLALKIDEVRAVNDSTDGVEILAGAEVDIKPDGSLDYPDEVLSELDFVVASVHGSFSQDGDLMTKRVVRALENPFVHALGHPTARVIGRRAPCAMDMEKVTDAAFQNGKALEINSSCRRLDLKDGHVRLAVKKGVKLIVSTDAHAASQLEDIVCGVAVARRGWAEAADILNSLPLADLMKIIKRR